MLIASRTSETLPPRVLPAAQLLQLLFPFATVGLHGLLTAISHTHSNATRAGLDHPCTISQIPVTIFFPVFEQSALLCTGPEEAIAGGCLQAGLGMRTSPSRPAGAIPVCLAWM